MRTLGNYAWDHDGRTWVRCYTLADWTMIQWAHRTYGGLIQ